MDTNPQLLLALFAFKQGLIDHERLLTAWQAFAGGADTSPGELLVKRGWITPRQRTDLEGQVRQHLSPMSPLESTTAPTKFPPGRT